MQDNGSRDIFTVSRLNQEVRRLLESHWAHVWLIGEISNLSRPGSGHWYFTLKDDQAQIRCAMFRGNNQRVTIPVAQGLQVMVRARLSLYEPRGDYQLIVEHMEAAGDGLLQQQFEQLKRLLAQEGLFAMERKQPLPTVRALGVITSPTGAALRDVLAVLQRRDPGMRVIVYPAQVQGADSAAQLRAALATAIRRNEVDALLITRGGGSLEDLWSFNDEALARDIANCPLPTVSAVGHEVDFTISDFVADLRAPTPSAAAEVLSQDRSVMVRHLLQLRERFWRSWKHYAQRQQAQVSHLQARLSPLSPRQKLEAKAQLLDDLQARLERAMQTQQQSRSQQLTQFAHRLAQRHPTRWLPNLQKAQQENTQDLQRAMLRFLNQQRQRFMQSQQSLQIVSPLNTLARGYSLSLDENGQVIRSTEQLTEGALIKTRLHEGEVESRVTKLLPRHSND
ncbi:MAG: exodeoxyribonuclease VII large subunit [Idiomarina sp.]|nr:exodeoxyribonuclease VII large subunit [Idiomarina sp.]